MPTIKPVSDLRDYNKVLKDVKDGEPVYLTKNGRGEYGIYSMDDVKKHETMEQLLADIEKGFKSGDEKGWIPIEEVEAVLKKK
jgi:PHD/YefM family antitoxin component YafN of YafNO toxin-antitoxin module